MDKLEYYIKNHLADCPLTDEQESKLLDAIESYLDDLGEYIKLKTRRREVIPCPRCKIGDVNTDWGCTNPECDDYPFKPFKKDKPTELNI